ncbi:MAG: RNA polymerase sigma-70 factor [Tannerella sp.]|jgi:RNA polymerase sigma-70 factor (ECF subfamily)|nr:RNA polymerase sigma-70 factor [Tannerella sp.]
MTKHRNEHDKMNEIACFEELFQNYYRELLAYAYKFVNDRSAAEDVVQDVFFIVWEKRTTLNFKDSIRPYLYKLIHNRAINYLNSFSVQRRIDNTEDIDFLISMEISDCDPYETLLLKDITDTIHRCVETFPPQRKNVFLLSRQNYLKHKEIARLLNISEKSVEKHISKALTDIRQCLIETGLISTLLYFIMK